MAVLPYAGMAVMYIVTWIDPYHFGDKMVGYLLLIMLMEFINVHAAGFLGSVFVSNNSRLKKVLFILGLGLFYSIFVGGFSLVFRVWWPLIAFWVLIASRLLSVFFGRPLASVDKGRIAVSWIGGMLCYMAAVFLTLFIPVPALGITDAVISHQRLPGSGIWISEPYRVVAAGFLYFTGVVIFSLFDDTIARKFKLTSGIKS